MISSVYSTVASVRCGVRDFDARDRPSSSLLPRLLRSPLSTHGSAAEQPSQELLAFFPSTDGHVHREFILFVFVHPWPLLLVITISDCANASGRCGTVLYCVVRFTRVNSDGVGMRIYNVTCAWMHVYGNWSPASVRLLCMQNIQWTIFVYDRHGKYYSKWGGLFFEAKLRQYIYFLWLRILH